MDEHLKIGGQDKQKQKMNEWNASNSLYIGELYIDREISQKANKLTFSPLS